jgi:hypothetical protein
VREGWLGRRVRVHVNLHKQRFAVLDPRTGRVIGYVDDITLTGVTFRHQPRCVDRIRTRRVRAVCAYALGTIHALDTDEPVTGRPIAYNPLRRDDFHHPDTGEHVDTAHKARFVGVRAYLL